MLKNGEESQFDILINAAGLGAGNLANKNIKLVKGEYFQLSHNIGSKINSLIYPL